jgi:hypothetical protein
VSGLAAVIILARGYAIDNNDTFIPSR